MTYIIYWSLILAGGITFVAAADTKFMDKFVRKIFCRRSRDE